MVDTTADMTPIMVDMVMVQATAMVVTIHTLMEAMVILTLIVDTLHIIMAIHIIPMDMVVAMGLLVIQVATTNSSNRRFLSFLERSQTPLNFGTMFFLHEKAWLE